jgi:3-oxoacyl-[acyl-carrier-protein] synthase-3
MQAVIKGVGHYLPEKIVTNHDLESMVDTNDQWIVERTGIKQRHIAAEGEFTSDIASKAAIQAIDKSGIRVQDIDLVIVATSTPDLTLPATATIVQQKIGMKRGAAYDMNAACSGFIYGLMQANAAIKSRQASTVLVIGAETFSRIVDWNDRSTCILFGDGAGAVVLQAEEDTERGILHAEIFSDGTYTDILKTKGGVSTTGDASTLFMEGKEVFRHAVSKMTATIEHSLKTLGSGKENLDWVIGHQANARILSAIAKKFDLPEHKNIITVHNHANTSAASIPLALSVALDEQKLQKNDIIVMPALGAGLTWGASIVRW